MLLVGGSPPCSTARSMRRARWTRARSVVIPKERGRARDRRAAGARGHRHRPAPVHRRLSVGKFAAWLEGGKPVQLKAGDYAVKQNASIRQVIDLLVRGQDRGLQGDGPGGSDQPPDRRAAEGRREPRPARSRPCRRRDRCCRRPSSSSAACRGRRSSTRMQAEARKLVEKAWAQRKKDLPFKTLEEAIVLASIVEKETGRSDERERVAAVFINRLRQNMRLQSDPTILYGHQRRQGRVEPADPEERDRPEDLAQHLPDRRLAADADLQPGPRRDRGRAQSGRHQGALFRRRRHRRPRVLRNAQGPQRQRAEMARGREGHQGQDSAGAAARHADHGSPARRGPSCALRPEKQGSASRIPARVAAPGGNQDGKGWAPTTQPKTK